MSPRSLRLPGHETEIDIEGVSLLTGVGGSLIAEITEQVRAGAVTRASYELGSSTLSVVTEPSDESVVVLVGSQFWDSPFGDDGDTALRALLSAASRTVATLSAEFDCLEGDHNIARRAHEAILDEIDSTRARIDPHSAAHLHRLRRAIDGTARRSEENLDSKGSSAESEPESTKLTTVAVEPVRKALAALEAVPAAVASASGPSPGDLADELEELTDRVTEIERSLDSEGVSRDERQLALHEARKLVNELEKSHEPETVSVDDIAELEAAHERVLEAEGRVSGRFGGGKAMKQLEQATEQEQVILDRLGFTTWSAFIMGTTLFGSDDESPGSLGEARAAMKVIEKQVGELSKRLNEDPDYAALQHRRSAVLKAATELVGIRPDVLSALRDLEDSSTSSTPDAVDDADGAAIQDALTSALVAAEVIDEGETFEAEDLVKIASDWLADVDAAEADRAEADRAEADRAEADRAEAERAEADRAEAEQSDGEAKSSELVIEHGDEADSPDPARLRALEDATERLEQHRAALQRTAALLEEVEMLRDQEVAAQTQLEQHRSRLEGARRGRAHLAAQLVGSRLRSGSAGADPYSALTETGEVGLVLVDPLDRCKLDSEIVLEALGVFAEHTALTLISDDPEVVAWADNQDIRVVEVDRVLAAS